MKKRIEYVFQVTQRAPLSYNESRIVWNVGEGEPDVEVMAAAIMSREFPAVPRETVTTIYRILVTRRIEETRDSFPALWALVRVSCEGNYLNEWSPVEGLYEIKVAGYHDRTRVTFRKIDPPEAQPKQGFLSWLFLRRGIGHRETSMLYSRLPTVGEIYHRQKPGAKPWRVESR